MAITWNRLYQAGGTDVAVADGGTGASTLTDHGVLLGSGTGAVTPTAVGAAGEYLAGSAGADPGWATLNQAAVAGLTTESSPVFAGLTVDTNTLSVDSVNHRLGICKTVPSYPLDIVGNGRWLGFLCLGRYDPQVGTTQVGITCYPLLTAAATIARGMQSGLVFAAGTYTVSEASKLSLGAGEIPTGVTVTNGYGSISREPYVNGGTLSNYYDFHSSVDAAANRWSFYAAGTANNYFAGKLGLGITPLEQIHASDTVRADMSFNLNGTDGATTTLTLDDGANWRITATFTGGILTAKTTAASSGAAATWS